MPVGLNKHGTVTVHPIPLTKDVVRSPLSFIGIKTREMVEGRKERREMEGEEKNRE